MKPSNTESYLSTGLYFTILIIIQSIINIKSISDKCDGNLSDNMGMALYSTIFPWLFIFGVLILVLTLYPGFKSAFSNVIGYYLVYSNANNLLATLMKTDANQDPNISTTLSRIYGDKAILINKMSPSNFSEFIKVLGPIMKQPVDLEKIKKLENLVVYKDNVGEFCWYLYTAILVISIVEYNIASMKCKKSDIQIDKEIENYNKN
jgi:hypothetical protein